MSRLPPRPLPSDAELEAMGWVKRHDCNLKIASTPRVGQYFWIDFPRDAFAPEFVGEHPGLVVRAARRLHDTCIVVPLTSRPQEDAKHKHQLGRNPNPKGHTDGILPWAVCDHLYTVHLGRLRPLTDRYNHIIYPKADPADMEAIFAEIRAALHHVFPAPPPASTSDAPTPAPSRPLGPNTLTLGSKKSDAVPKTE
jgi:uncharacterized protein YifN (PemK superfamily)